MINAYCTHNKVVNSGITERYLTKFLHDVQKLLPINLLKSKF